MAESGHARPLSGRSTVRVSGLTGEPLKLHCNRIPQREAEPSTWWKEHYVIAEFRGLIESNAHSIWLHESCCFHAFDFAEIDARLFAVI